MAAKHPHILRTTCTATALSVMLAACGGGGGGGELGKAVLASSALTQSFRYFIEAACTR